MKSRAIPTICLGPTGNFQGTYNFLNLVSGLVIKRQSFNELPAPQSIINCVNSLAAKSVVSTNLIFANRKRVPFHWNTLPADIPDTRHHAPYPYPDIPAEILGVLIQQDADDYIPSANSDNPTGMDWTDLADAAAENADLATTMGLPPPPDIINIDDEDVFQLPLTQSVSPLNPTIPKVKPSPPPPSSPPTSCYPSRDRCPPTYLNDFVFTTVSPKKSLPQEYPYQAANVSTVDLAIQDERQMAHICHYVMTHTANSLYSDETVPSKNKQCSLKAGLKEFGARGHTAISKELAQLHTLKCFQPKDPATLTRDERCKALTSLIFLTHKKQVKLKLVAVQTAAPNATMLQKKKPQHQL
jgi:hypothetical protein